MRYRELSHELAALRRCYPPFVTSRSSRLDVGDIPVFVFHTIDPREFEAQLIYLVENGYSTLRLCDFLDLMDGLRRPSGREVLLTIDDARTSFWLYGFPLLRRYGLQATLFVITGWTPDRPVRPNLDDVVAGRISHDALRGIDPDDRDVSSWAELRVMVESGLVSVDSHSHLHRRAFCGRALSGVIEPRADFSPSNAIHAPYLRALQSPLDLPKEDFVGLPLFPVRGYFEDGTLLRAPTDALRSFADRARSLLTRHDGRLPRNELDRLRTMAPGDALREISQTEARAEMLEDLALARDLLRNRLGDPAAGRTLCVPFTLGGIALVGIARELGLRGVFWGISPDRTINRPGADPMHLVRLKHDFIWRLPGRGRRTVVDIYGRKLLRRLTGQRPY